MNLRFDRLDKATVVIPEGRLDFGAAAGFQAQLEQLLAGADGRPSAVIIDCAALDYVSSAGLRAFLLGAKTARRGGIPFALCTLKPAVREVLELSGFTQIITVYADRTAALAAATRAPT